MNERPNTTRKDSLPNNIGSLNSSHLVNLDPAHQQVNPSVVEDHLFKSNSHLYGSGRAVGGASSWDAVEPPEPRDTEYLDPVLSKQPSGHRAYHGVTPTTVSINNILGNEANNLASNAPELGKLRSNNPRDAASRVDQHSPTMKEKVVGKTKVLIAKATGNKDLYSSGEAEEEGRMEVLEEKGYK